MSDRASPLSNVLFLLLSVKVFMPSAKASTVIRPFDGLGDWLEKVTEQAEMPLVRAVAQLGCTCPPLEVKLMTVPSGTALPWRSATRMVNVVVVPSIS